MLIGNNFFWFKRIREKILLNYKTRTFFENLFILKPIIRSQAEQVFDLVSGFVYSQILYACVSLELFEKLREGPLTLVEISKSCDIEITEMEILVEGAIAIGLLEKRERNTIGLGVKGMMVTEIKGFGSQSGHTEIYRGAEYAVNFVPKIKLEIVVEQSMSDEVVETIKKSAHTGKIGDGKIFVLDVQQTIRVRTGETGADAV